MSKTQELRGKIKGVSKGFSFDAWQISRRIKRPARAELI